MFVPAVAWLALLPNAPYLWTDLIHLSDHGRRLFVTDFVVICSFATAGLLAGYASLYLVHSVFQRAFGAVAGWVLVAAVLPLVSFGCISGV